MLSPSSDTRVSRTCVSSCWQKGHFMARAPEATGVVGVMPSIRAACRLLQPRTAPSCCCLAGVDRESVGQLLHFGLDAVDGRSVVRIVEHVGDQVADLDRFGLAETAGGHGRAAEADAGGDERFFRI